MLKRITATVLVILFAVLIFGCADRKGKDTPSDTSHNAVSEQESALSAAKAAAKEADTQDGDIIIVCDEIIMAASCYKVENGEVILLYDGDYQGSYDNLDCIHDGEYDEWKVFVYRKKTVASTLSKPELDALAQTILDSYLERYGELKAGSFICLTEPDGTVYQYVSLTAGGVEYIDETDVRYNVWENSAQADDYWAKYVHEDANETSWAVYEYDTGVTRAFERIADMAELLPDIANGTIFVYSASARDIIMRYEDGTVIYVQTKDWSYMEDDYTLADTSDIKNAPEKVRVYIPN